MPARLAIVEDDREVRSLLQRSLAAEGYGVTALARGAEIEELIERDPHDLVLVDVGLPDIDGLTLTRRLRARFDVGIIIISGYGGLDDRVVGLELGADDYLAKPFEIKEVLARVRSVLRRQQRAKNWHGAMPDEIFRFDGWCFDCSARSLRGEDDESVGLTTGEYRLLDCFVRHPGRVLSRVFLIEQVHDNDVPVFDRSIDVTVARLRKKLGAGRKTSDVIKTVRNGGYVFAAKVT